MYVLKFEYETDITDDTYTDALYTLENMTNLFDTLRCIRDGMTAHVAVAANLSNISESLQTFEVSSFSVEDIEILTDAASFTLKINYDAASVDVAKNKAIDIAQAVPSGYNYTAVCGDLNVPANMILDTWKLRGHGLNRSGSISPTNRDINP